MRSKKKDDGGLNEFEDRLNILISGGDRTRGILYFLGLMSAALLAITVESAVFPWPEARYQHVAKAFSCYTHHVSETGAVPTTTNDLCKDHYDYVRNFYFINVPDNLNDSYDYHLTWDSLYERYKLLTKEYVENASTALPIIGTKIDKGNAFIFGAFITIIVVYALKRSIDSEIRGVSSIIKLIQNKSQADDLILVHVFSQPNITGQRFWYVLYVPATIIGMQVILDLKKAPITFGVFSTDTSTIFTILQIALFASVFIVSYACFRSARALDVQLAAVEMVPFPDAPDRAA